MYRGSIIPGLAGTYFFSDYCTSTIWSFRYVGGQVTEVADAGDDLDEVSVDEAAIDVDAIEDETDDAADEGSNANDDADEDADDD